MTGNEICNVMQLKIELLQTSRWLYWIKKKCIYSFLLFSYPRMRFVVSYRINDWKTRYNYEKKKILFYIRLSLNKREL